MNREANSQHEATIALATVLTATPGLRAKFFANPTTEVAKRLPAGKSWDYGEKMKRRWLPWKWQEAFRKHRKPRAELAQKILLEIAGQVRDKKLSASVNTDAVFEEYFAPIVRVSQRSFNSVFLLSWGAFAAGLGLIGVGAYTALHPAASTNSTVVASVFGGSGAISALGAVFAMAKQGIREATLDHARLRVVLTAFATQLGQLRAVAEYIDPRSEVVAAPDLESAQDLNNAITQAVKAAVNLIPALDVSANPPAPVAAVDRTD